MYCLLIIISLLSPSIKPLFISPSQCLTTILLASYLEIKVLHVRSISDWAPLCIGPYAQANVLANSLIYVAGQIPLNPSSMEVYVPSLPALPPLPPNITTSSSPPPLNPTSAATSSSTASVTASVLTSTVPAAVCSRNSEIIIPIDTVSTVYPSKSIKLDRLLESLRLQLTLCLRHVARVLDPLNSSLRRSLGCTVYLNMDVIERDYNQSVSVNSGGSSDGGDGGDGRDGRDANLLDGWVGWSELSSLAGQLMACNCNETIPDLDSKSNRNTGDIEDSDESDSDYDYEDTGGGMVGHDQKPGYRNLPVLIVGVKGIPRDCLVEAEVVSFSNMMPLSSFVSNQCIYHLPVVPSTASRALHSTAASKTTVDIEAHAERQVNGVGGSHGDDLDTDLWPIWHRVDACPSIPHNDLPPAIPRNDLPPSIPRNDLPPSIPRNDLPPSISRNDLPPSIPRNDLPPSIPRNDLPPAIPHNDLPPSIPRNDLPPSIPRNDLPPSIPRNDLPPSISRNDLPPSIPRNDRPPSDSGDGRGSDSNSGSSNEGLCEESPSPSYVEVTEGSCPSAVHPAPDLDLTTDTDSIPEYSLRVSSPASTSSANQTELCEEVGAAVLVASIRTTQCSRCVCSGFSSVSLRGKMEGFEDTEGERGVVGEGDVKGEGEDEGEGKNVGERKHDENDKNMMEKHNSNRNEGGSSKGIALSVYQQGADLLIFTVKERMLAAGMTMADVRTLRVYYQRDSVVDLMTSASFRSSRSAQQGGCEDGDGDGDGEGDGEVVVDVCGVEGRGANGDVDAGIDVDVDVDRIEGKIENALIKAARRAFGAHHNMPFLLVPVVQLASPMDTLADTPGRPLLACSFLFINLLQVKSEMWVGGH
jgi:hypothetical protein